MTLLIRVAYCDGGGIVVLTSLEKELYYRTHPRLLPYRSNAVDLHLF